ncbi:DUF624 domain-containing protein [Streptomyces prunicolor]|jgi:hypothetical protein|uniref:DUF624 domain-containing protein n=1 Tax=Streptomyces prunicolor TaxID=67348 RepID=UPI00036877AD|nr:DUF624 domain-containing protein [Streptomyces prunicolor]
MSSLAPQRREPGELFGPRFTLFADMLAVGVAAAVASLPLITVPTAFAAACALLRRSIREDRPVSMGEYVAEFRAHGLRRSVLAGVTVFAAVTLVVLDLALARAGLPGARPMSWALTALAATGLVLTLRAAADPEVARGWHPALNRAASRSATDPTGCALIAAAVGLCVAFLWMLPLLALLLPGPLAFAITAVELRGEPPSDTESAGEDLSGQPRATAMDPASRSPAS